MTQFLKNKVIEEVTDTIYNIYNNNKYNLKSSLYLSNQNRVTLPIHIKNKNNLVGWGIGYLKALIQLIKIIYRLFKTRV